MCLAAFVSDLLNNDDYFRHHASEDYYFALIENSCYRSYDGRLMGGNDPSLREVILVHNSVTIFWKSLR